MHLPSLSQALVFCTGYVTGCSIAVNVLPKDTVFNGYPRLKKGYGTFVLILAVSAFNLRKRLPGADLQIPGLGFGDYAKEHPEFFDGDYGVAVKQSPPPFPADTAKEPHP
jgi:hypothetical protein